MSCTDTTSVTVVNSDSVIRIFDIRHNGIQHQALILRLQESGGFTFDDGAEATWVNHKVVRVAELIEG